jgi:glycosyltransferase involved in cell wall biosynthesis
MDKDPNGGCAAYLRHLIENLGYLDTENSYTIYYAHPRALNNRNYLSPQFKTRVLWPSSSWIEIPISLPVQLLFKPVDVLHAPVLGPPICPCPIVQTIHDVDWERHPNLFPRTIRLRLSKLVRLTAKKAKKIITVSEFVKKCIMDIYNIAEEKIVVTHHGIDPQYKPIEDPKAIENVRLKYNIDCRFILYVGKLQARKNIPRLLKAFYILKRERHLPYKLVLVGRKTWLSSDIISTLNELRLQDEVIFTGEVPLKELLLFYNAADLFVFPSLCEGFGIPPLEAMACGTPVVASNETAIPEVVGDAGILVNPYNVEELAQAMSDVLTSENLKKDLISRGLKRITAFSYKKMAEKVIEVYTEVFNMKNR